MTTLPKLFSLHGKTALITGATGYLGKEISLALAEAGANLFLNSRSESDCDELAKRLQKYGNKYESTAFDLTSQIEIQKFAEEKIRQPIDIIINNAYAGGSGTESNSRKEDYLASYEITVVAASNIVRCLRSNLDLAVQKNNSASVVNICSMYALKCPRISRYKNKESANPPYYGSAKAALLQWTKYAACEFGASGIRFNAISPGALPSPQSRKGDPELMEQLISSIPLGRLGDAQDIRGAIVYLCSDASKFVNGANIVIDGGMTLW